MIWKQFDQKATFSMADLKALFPDKKTVQTPAFDNGEKYKHQK